MKSSATASRKSGLSCYRPSIIVIVCDRYVEYRAKSYARHHVVQRIGPLPLLKMWLTLYKNSTHVVVNPQNAQNECTEVSGSDE